MLPLYTVLFQFGEIFFDLELLLKIAGLLFIYNFVKSHLPDRPVLSAVLIIGLSAFLLFDVWKIFGSALFLYLLVIYGFSHILVDLSFMHAFGPPGGGGGGGGHAPGGKGLQHKASSMLFGRGGGKH